MQNTSNENFIVGGAASECTQVFHTIQSEDTEPVNSHTDERYPYLSVIKGPHTGDAFDLISPLITIGRDPECDIFLNDMTVSREHASLIVQDNGVYLEDLGSLNGTWVDGAIVNEALLTEGSQIQIGTFVMVLHMNKVQSYV